MEYCGGSLDVDSSKPKKPPGGRFEDRVKQVIVGIRARAISFQGLNARDSILEEIEREIEALLLRSDREDVNMNIEAAHTKLDGVETYSGRLKVDA